MPQRDKDRSSSTRQTYRAPTLTSFGPVSLMTGSAATSGGDKKVGKTGPKPMKGDK